MNDIKVSKALLEVWEWKEAAYQEVANLSIKQAIQKRIKDSIKTAKKLGFIISVLPNHRRITTQRTGFIVSGKP